MTDEQVDADFDFVRTLASPGRGGSPAAGSSDEQVYAAPRLFEEMAATAEPDDMASFYHGLTHGQGALAAAMRRAAQCHTVQQRAGVLLPSVVLHCAVMCCVVMCNDGLGCGVA